MKIITLLTIALISVSCSSSKPSQSKINALEVSEKLVKGKTTQAQVLESFGAPDVVEKTPEGDMWAYNRHANESKSFGGGLVHYANAAGLWNWTGAHIGADESTSSTNTASLILYFQKNKLLKTYSYRTEKF